MYSVAPTRSASTFNNLCPGNWYENSVSVYCHRCQAQVYVIWLDAAGNYMEKRLHPQRRQCSRSGGKGPARPAARIRSDAILPETRTARTLLCGSVSTVGVRKPTPFLWSPFRFHLGPAYVTQWSPRTSTLRHSRQITTGSVNADRSGQLDRSDTDPFPMLSSSHRSHRWPMSSLEPRTSIIFRSPRSRYPTGTSRMGANAAYTVAAISWRCRALLCLHGGGALIDKHGRS